MPGTSSANSRKLRPSSGRFTTCEFSTIVPTAVESRSSAIDAAVTTTCSEGAPTCRATSNRRSWLTNSSNSSMWDLNPARVTSSRYGPGGRALTTYWPSSAVSTLRTRLVSRWVTRRFGPAGQRAGPVADDAAHGGTWRLRGQGRGDKNEENNRQETAHKQDPGWSGLAG